MDIVTYVNYCTGLTKELVVLGRPPRARAVGLSRAEIGYDAVYICAARAAFAISQYHGII